MLFDGSDSHGHIIGNLRIGPSAIGQHGDGEFGGCQIIGDILFCNRIVDTPPSITELISNLNDFLVILRIIILNTCFDEPL